MSIRKYQFRRWDEVKQDFVIETVEFNDIKRLLKDTMDEDDIVDFMHEIENKGWKKITPFTEGRVINRGKISAEYICDRCETITTPTDLMKFREGIYYCVECFAMVVSEENSPTELCNGCRKEMDRSCINDEGLCNSCAGRPSVDIHKIPPFDWKDDEAYEWMHKAVVDMDQGRSDPATYHVFTSRYIFNGREVSLQEFVQLELASGSKARWFDCPKVWDHYMALNPNITEEHAIFMRKTSATVISGLGCFPCPYGHQTNCHYPLGCEEGHRDE